MGVPFVKMSGAGNTFVVIDNRDGVVADALKTAGISLERFVVRACSPVHGAATDGLILLEPSTKHDFTWRFFNADASAAGMCGNGARCAAWYAHEVGIAGQNMCFETGAGVVSAAIDEQQVVITLTPPSAISAPIKLTAMGQQWTGYAVNTGVPHVVIEVPSLSEIDVPALGSEIRHDKQFEPDGTNVNFVGHSVDGHLKVRTFERGVEGETLACGTGVTAAALVRAHLGDVQSPVRVQPLSGEFLTIRFEREGDRFTNVQVAGPAKVLLSGTLEMAALG